MYRILLILILCLFSIVVFLFHNASAEEHDIELNWTHSGRGMDRFVFQHSSSDSGTWSQGIVVMIADLSPIEKDGKVYWNITLIVDVDNQEEVRWWRCYAETSYGLKSQISLPAKSIFTPKGLKVYI